MSSLPTQCGVLFLVLILLSTGCSSPSDQTTTPTSHSATTASPPPLDEAQLYDKVLGMLLGSAIGDAMGAPTEMWSRRAMAVDYGFVDRLDTMVRPPSPEGTWQYNLPAGGTTDDTRWKKLMVNYLLTPSATFDPSDPPEAQGFARYIIREYTTGIRELKATESFDPEPFEASSRKVAWLQEWARVAKPFVEDDLEGYATALSRFYGGEMTCAGMLYTPTLGVYFPGQPETAYRTAYSLSLFDLGYARDVSALTAAMVAAAMRPNPTPAGVLNVLRDVDPEGYFKSRLVGRSAYRIYREARDIVYSANRLLPSDLDTLHLSLPTHLAPDTLFWGRAQRAYELLDQRNQDMPFHAGEIHLVNLTALLFCNFDVETSLAFVINYGRDNDTTGAVTGAILGAYWGASGLPDEMKEQVLAADRMVMQTNLPQLAQQLTDRIMKRY